MLAIASVKKDIDFFVHAVFLNLFLFYVISDG